MSASKRTLLPKTKTRTKSSVKLANASSPKPASPFKPVPVDKISQRDAFRIVQDPNLPLPDGPESRARSLALLPKSKRLHFMRTAKDSEDGRVSAAIEIQRKWRGFLARRNIKKLLTNISSLTAVYGGSKHVLARNAELDEFANIINDPVLLHDRDGECSDSEDIDNELENERKRNDFEEIGENKRRFLANLPKDTRKSTLQEEGLMEMEDVVEYEYEGNSVHAMSLSEDIQTKLQYLQNMMFSAIKNDSSLDDKLKQQGIEEMRQLVDEARQWLTNPGLDENGLGKKAVRKLLTEGRSLAQTCVDLIKQKKIHLCDEIEVETNKLTDVCKQELGNSPQAMSTANDIQDNIHLLKNKMHAAIMKDPVMESSVDQTEPWVEQTQQWTFQARTWLLNPGRDQNNLGKESVHSLVAEGRRLARNFYDEAKQELLNLCDNIEAMAKKLAELCKQDLEERIKRKKRELPFMHYDDTVKYDLLQMERQATPIKHTEPLTKDDAAIIIQRSWRRHIDIQVYKYYRDLINFKTRGDPMMMLRCINPNEAKLLDPAAGIHIRFRLAGQRFPPNIYYKIYTHRPVVDMCANSPKDYTVPAAKLTKAKDTHNKNRQTVTQGSQEGWYLRIDNNGWRLVSDRLINHIMSDSVAWETSQKKYHFHHDRLKRKQDVDKRKKEKKINWMKKMYKDGMLKARSDDSETVKLIEGAAAGMVATVDSLGPEALEEWEVDELLDWTTSLNFDDYLTSWKDIATSSDSEKKIVDRLHIVTNNMDPYEMTLSTGPSRFQSTRQSHNTPVSSASNKIWVTVA